MIGGKLEQQAPHLGSLVTRARVFGPPQRAVETLHVLDQQWAACTCAVYWLEGVPLCTHNQKRATQHKSNAAAQFKNKSDAKLKSNGMSMTCNVPSDRQVRNFAQHDFDAHVHVGRKEEIGRAWISCFAAAQNLRGERQRGRLQRPRGRVDNVHDELGQRGGLQWCVKNERKEA